jgi:hypothetical protein
MTITIQKTSTVKTEGTRINGNCKPVLCITTGEIFSSASDAAEAMGVCASAMSWILTGRAKTCKGKRFCYVANVTEHLDEIAECMRAREQKVAAYNELMAQQEALHKAKEKYAKCKAKVEELTEALNKATHLMKEAESELAALNH